MAMDLSDRIKDPVLLDRVVPAEQAAMLVKDGMTVATSGFTPAGYPKAVPLAIARRIEEDRENLKINLFTGASVGDELDGALSRAGIIHKRLPYQTDASLRRLINSGDVLFVDPHLSQVAQQCRYGFLGPVDVAIVEATMITRDGNIVPSTSVGASPTYVSQAQKVIVEVNTTQPLDLVGMHDIYVPRDPPNRRPVPLTSPGQRIGTPYIPCGSEKIAAVVVTSIRDGVRPLSPVNDVSRAIASHLIEFLENEVEKGRLPANLLPVQSGVGSVANAVLAGLLDSRFTGMTFYSEVIQDSAVRLLDTGQFTTLSGTSLTLSPDTIEQTYSRLKRYKKKIILRPQEVTNNPEVIRRLGCISVNTAIEVDIYGNVNSTNVLGSSMMNGIGGSGDFSRNAYLSIFTTESVAKGGAISAIVPMVSHVDHTEHDVHVIVTEQGLADLRGLAPRERASVVIDNCAHPDYRPMLHDYVRRARQAGGHTPHILKEALSWHSRYIETGTMR